MRMTQRICAQDLEILKQTEEVVALANEVGHSSVRAALPMPQLVGTKQSLPFQSAHIHAIIPAPPLPVAAAGKHILSHGRLREHTRMLKPRPGTAESTSAFSAGMVRVLLLAC